MFMSLLALLLLRYRITHGTIGSHGTTAAVLCALYFVIAPHGVSVCVLCLCASVGNRYVCVECVLSQNQYPAAAQQQRQHNASRVSRSCLCASSHGVCTCAWRTARDDRTPVSVFTSNATIKNTSSDLAPGIRSIQQRQNK